MPVTLSFTHTHDYGDRRESGIGVPLNLTVGENSIRVLAKVDTGATFCIFQREYGEQLGLNIEAGERQTVYTANGRFEVYGHEVTMECFGYQLRALAYFASDPAISRNVLGRRGWIQQFRLAIVDHDSTLHLSQYDEA